MTEWRTVPAESWRDHVEQMLRTWQCRHLNEDGDRLALDDFMGQESIEDLIDFVCDAWSGPAPAPVALTDEERQVRNLLAVIHRDGGHYAAEHGIAKACVDAIQAWYAPSDEVSRLTAERDALRAALDTFVRIHRVAGTPNAISDADLVVWTQEAIDAARAALKDAP